MTDNEKARAAGGTAERAETAALAGATISEEQSTAAVAQRQDKIAALLPQGAENAIPTARLAELAGCTSNRELQKRIELERRHGALILSRSGYGGGYFLPSDGAAGKREISEYVQTLHARALNTLRTLRSARAALEEIDGQEEIMEGNNGD